MSRTFESFLAPIASGCIEWTGVTVKSNGRESHRYGRFTRDGKKHLAHRYAYALAHGQIPDGLQVLHSCDNTRCCNVKHLFLGTHLDNMRDAHAKGRTYRGGPLVVRRGENANGAKLSDAQVLAIYAERAKGRTTVAIAADYGVSACHISRVVRGLSHPVFQPSPEGTTP